MVAIVVSHESDVVSAPGSVAAAPTPIRVASVPSGHVYVRHLTPLSGAPDARAVSRLPDPEPGGPPRAAATWWPPVMLEPTWLELHDDFDLMHLHFGFDACTPQRLTEVLDIVQGRGTPFVYTAHDLRNPHHRDRRKHDAQLQVLMRRVDAVITLTTGAAAEIARRWGRIARVIPHPHVVELSIMERIQRERAARPGAARPGAAQAGPGKQPFRVGVHLKSLRAGMAPVPVLQTLLRAVAELPGAVLQVNGHTDVLSPAGARYDPAVADLLADAQRAGLVDLRVHDFLPDAELWDYLASLDVSVLPYRFGTHSGWLEACRDLGTTVIAPDCGHYRDQGPVFSYHHDEHGLDADSLVTALVHAYEAPRAEAVPAAARARQRTDIGAAHLSLYRSLLGR